MGDNGDRGIGVMRALGGRHHASGVQVNNVRPYITDKLPGASDEKRKRQYRVYLRLHVPTGRDCRSMERSNVLFLDYLGPGSLE